MCLYNTHVTRERFQMIFQDVSSHFKLNFEFKCILYYIFNFVAFLFRPAPFYLFRSRLSIIIYLSPFYHEKFLHFLFFFFQLNTRIRLIPVLPDRFSSETVVPQLHKYQIIEL